ncbi:class I SAM-dependent methyltransferase [Actinoplanes sp. N902-109]|uniref:class I SAM-dependent methyltransferase n=1 Tax=Actinoplanes sp. (strain N902-109) TaxID=649831 RepID=UPI000329531E|nr:methyltransferase [Actinoplanes sp. N902-109]AGL14470.1 methyltransferase [Actinoplanes sp. N902-109]
MSADHYFSADPAAPETREHIEFTAAGREYTLVTSRGIFSAGRLDPGTAVLLRKGDLPDASATGTFLDIGCGYGPITCVLAAEAPRSTVYAIDVNSRARALTGENAAALGLAGRVRVLAPDDVPAELRFDQIWSNPPTHIGKAELHELVDRWLARLAPDGVAWLVINRNLGGDTLHASLTAKGWAVTRTASQRGFRVLRVTRPA